MIAGEREPRPETMLVAARNKEAPVRGLMMDVPLLLSSVLRHASTYHGDTEVVSRSVEGGIHRTSYGEVWGRSQQLANALASLGLEPGDRVGTLAWNTWRHLEIYYAVSGSGMVCHTINPRLFPDQIAYIVNHAGDRIIFADLTFLPLLENLAARLDTVEAVVVMTSAAQMPQSDAFKLLCYEDLLGAEPATFPWPVFDENTAASLCYTSGTTGEPKGVLYSHRSSVLHAMAICLADVFGFKATDAVLPVVPMFHVNAWGVPYAAPIAGSKLVLPGPGLDGASLHDLMTSEGVTFAAGVPTVWLALLDWAAANRTDFGALKTVAVGGSAAPPALIERFEALGVEVLHAWGMTETSPVGLSGSPKRGHRDLPRPERIALRAKQGRPIFGMEFQIVDDEGHASPRDGSHFGNMRVRGPWVAASYFRAGQAPAFDTGGWFDTGDVVTMDADGYVQIVDRTKDVIKSGGEWISSIELENIALAHPSVYEAAVVARPDPRWGERPVLVVVLREHAAFSKDDMAAHFAGKVAKWCIPDAVIQVEELPHTATGELSKLRIRAMVEATDNSATG